MTSASAVRGALVIRATHRPSSRHCFSLTNHCAGCDTPQGGSCVAFGLYGQMAIEVIEALDRWASASEHHQREGSSNG